MVDPQLREFLGMLVYETRRDITHIGDEWEQLSADEREINCKVGEKIATYVQERARATASTALMRMLNHTPW